MRELSKTNPSLPTELYRPIVNWIPDQASIYTLLFVNSFLNYEAERALYRKVSPKGMKVQEKFFHHVHRRKRVAKLVLDLHISVPTYVSYWPRLSLALRALVNLKSLSISAPRTNSPKTHILDQCPFQLESFTWPFPFAENLFPFLENQPEIRRLSLRCEGRPQTCRWRGFQQQFPRNPLSSKALPRLSILTGTTPVVNSLLPGRNITHLFWLSGSHCEKPDLTSIGPALKNIRVLRYGVDEVSLDTIVNYLEKLEVLQWTNPYYQELIDNAPRLPQLQKIILPVPPPSTDFNFQNFIATLFATNPILCLVEIGFQENNGFRWFRGSLVPHPVILSDADEDGHFLPPPRSS